MSPEIFKAYRKTKLNPVKDIFWVFSAGTLCSANPLTALAIVKYSPALDYDSLSDAVNKLDDEYGADYIYQWWNGYNYYTIGVTKSSQGYQDGLACRKAMENKFGPLGVE